MNIENMYDFMETSIPKEETIKSSLQDDYECTFNEYFGIFNLISPPEIKYANIEKYYNNGNIIVLIIESMCIGLLMPHHIAMKFKYIDNCIKYGDFSYIYEDGMKIVKVSKAWDTKKWSYSKIKNFYKYLDTFEQLSMPQIEFMLLNNKVSRKSCTFCDIEFLDSLCWDGDEL